MRYHYDKPDHYTSMYGQSYICDHPVYSHCTLYKIGEKGLAVIQQRYIPETKSTYWTEIDPWLVDGIGSIVSFLVDKSTIRPGWIIPFFSWKVWLRRSLSLINSIFSFGTGDKSRCTTVFDFSVLVDFDLILLL